MKQLQANLPADTTPALTPQLNPNRLLRLWEVLQLVPVKKSTWWLWCKQGKAPAPVHLGTRVTAWRYADVIAFIQGV